MNQQQQPIDIDKLSYKVQMIKYTVANGHADYVFKVVGPNSHSFHVRDRYSSMREFQSMLKKNLDNSVKLNDLPAFPKKRFLNGMDQNFLENRLVQLGQFFNTFLSNNQVAQDKLVLTYFGEKAADMDSQEKIVKLNDLIQQAKNLKRQQAGNNDGQQSNKPQGQQEQIQPKANSGMGQANNQQQFQNNEQNLQNYNQQTAGGMNNQMQNNQMMKNQNFNREQFDKECRAIIEQIKERFIDLTPVMMDDEGSNYIMQVAQKQKQFSQEFEKRLQQQQFDFDAPDNNKTFLQKPHGTVAEQEEEKENAEDEGNNSMDEIDNIDNLMTNGLHDLSATLQQFGQQQSQNAQQSPLIRQI